MHSFGHTLATVHLTAVEALRRPFRAEVMEYGGPLSLLEDQRGHICRGDAPRGAAASGPLQRQIELARSAQKRSREALEKLGPSHHPSGKSWTEILPSLQEPSKSALEPFAKETEELRARIRPADHWAPT